MSNHTGSGSWRDLDDVLQSLGAVSKLPKISKKSPKGLNLSAPPFHPADTRPDYGEFKGINGSLDASPPASGFGRGQYHESLYEKYSGLNGNPWVEKHQVIHEELRQLNPSGWSNDVIEERFGVLEDYKKLLNGIGSETESNTSSPAEAKPEADQFEDAKNGDDPKSLQADGSPSPKTKKRQRKCKNFVVLSLTSRMNLDGPILKGPDAFLPLIPATKETSPQKSPVKAGDWSLTRDEDCIFSPEEFPALS